MDVNLALLRLGIGLLTVLVLSLSAAAIGMALSGFQPEPAGGDDAAPPARPGPLLPCRPSYNLDDTRLAAWRATPESPQVEP